MVSDASRNASIAASVYSACSCLKLSPKTVSSQATVPYVSSCCISQNPSYRLLTSAIDKDYQWTCSRNCSGCNGYLWHIYEYHHRDHSYTTILPWQRIYLIERNQRKPRFSIDRDRTDHVRRDWPALSHNNLHPIPSHQHHLQLHASSPHPRFHYPHRPRSLRHQRRQGWLPLNQQYNLYPPRRPAIPNSMLPHIRRLRRHRHRYAPPERVHPDVLDGQLGLLGHPVFRRLVDALPDHGPPLQPEGSELAAELHDQLLRCQRGAADGGAAARGGHL